MTNTNVLLPVRPYQLTVREVTVLLALHGVVAVAVTDMARSLLPHPHPVPFTTSTGASALVIVGDYLILPLVAIGSVAVVLAFLFARHLSRSQDQAGKAQAAMVVASTTCVLFVITLAISANSITQIWYTVIDAHWINPTALAGWRASGVALVAVTAIMAMELAAQQRGDSRKRYASFRTGCGHGALILILNGIAATWIVYTLHSLPRDPRFDDGDGNSIAMFWAMPLIIAASTTIVATFYITSAMLGDVSRHHWLPDAAATAACVVFIAVLNSASHAAFANGAALKNVLSVPKDVLMRPSRMPVSPQSSNFAPQ